MSTKTIGDLGEEIASKFLKNKGFTVIERNYRKKWGEIDIIARKEGVVHFVEVKTVSCEKWVGEGSTGNEYRPEDNVHPQKLKRIHRALQTYIASHTLLSDWQIDVVTVKLSQEGREARCKLIENIV